MLNTTCPHFQTKQGFCGRKGRRHNQRQGAMLVMIAVVMIIFIVGAMFSIDVAQIHMVRAELRTATDAAARAGAESLARTQDPDAAVQAAIDVAAQNTVAGRGLVLTPQEIFIGGTVEQSDGKLVFEEDAQPFGAVRVIGRRDNGSAQGSVPLLFAKIFGITDFQPVQVATASATVRDIALVLDRSGSMNAQANGTTRIEALKRAVDVFLSEIELTSPNSRISLTTYSTNSTRDIALTEQFNTIRNEVDQLPAQGFTNIFEALQQGSDSLEQDQLRRRFAEKTIVLMTDGNFNVGGSPVPSARIAADRDQTIHTITFSDGANQQAMRTIANIGEGIHIHADDGDDLAEAFQEIARTLSVLLVE